MHFDQVPLVPKDMKRLNVPIEKHVYSQAKNLGIKLQAVCRQAIQEAVLVVQQKRLEEEFNGKNVGEITDPLLDAVIRLKCKDTDRAMRTKMSERIKNAVVRV